MKKILSIVMVVSLALGLTGAASAASVKTTKPATQQVKTTYVVYPGNGSALKIKKGYKKEVVLKEMKPMAVQVFNIFGGYFTTNDKVKEKNIKSFNAFVDKAIPKTYSLDIESTKNGYVMRQHGAIWDAESKDLVKFGKELQKITNNTKLGQKIYAWEDNDTLTINFMYDTKVAGDKYQSTVQFQFSSLNDKYYVLTGIYTN